uniref:putative speedy protein E7 n=1 Tax=Jaculus jaculus TaxID=51337 RepID=UPI0003331BDC|nr:putative speedy protein E7 [Jaculus jaculus]
MEQHTEDIHSMDGYTYTYITIECCRLCARLQRKMKEVEAQNQRLIHGSGHVIFRDILDNFTLVFEVCLRMIEYSKSSRPQSTTYESLAVAPEKRARRMRGLMKSRLTEVFQDKSSQACRAAASEAVSGLQFCRRKGQKRTIWSVNCTEGTKVWMYKKRRSSYRPEDLEAFFRLLEDPVIQSFLASDKSLKVSDKYLLSMVVEYFGRVGLPGHMYNRIHFFLALYIACDMEESDPITKVTIIQCLLGKEHWKGLCKEFLKLKTEFFKALEYRAWVKPDLCEEIQNQNPQHWVWSRVREGTH